MELRKFRTDTAVKIKKGLGLPAARDHVSYVEEPVLHCTALYYTVLHCTDHVYPAVEEPVLLDGDEALHLPAELVRGLARHHPRCVELRRRVPPVHLDILPGRQGRGYYPFLYWHCKVNVLLRSRHFKNLSLVCICNKFWPRLAGSVHNFVSCCLNIADIHCCSLCVP